MNNTAKKSVYIFGDSVMKGVIQNKDSGKYVFDPMMNKLLNDSLGRNVINCSYFGSTIEKGIQRIKYTVEGNVEADLAIIEYGGNDCDFHWKEIACAPENDHEPNTPINIFKEKYISVINYLKEKGITPIAMTLPPIDSKKYFEHFTSAGLSKDNILKWLGDIEMISRFQELYSMAVVEAAIKTGTFLADVRSFFLDKHNFKALLCNDGIHPNEEGHKLIATALGEVIKL